MSEIIYRFLKPDEYHMVEGIFRDFGAKIPLPNLSMIAVAEEDGAMSFYAFQLLPHAEPMFIHPKHRGTKVWIKLASMIKPLSEVRPTFIVAESKESEAMCKAMGMKKVNYPVYITVNKESTEESTNGV